MLLSQFKCLGFSLDFMRVKFIWEEWFDTLNKFCSYIDADNSNYTVQFWYDEEFTITRVGEFFMLRPVDFNFDVIRVQFGTDGVMLDFYSSFFRWSGYPVVFHQLLGIPHVFYRVDISMDLLGCKPVDLLKCAVFSLPVTTINDNQTIYIGDWKSNRKLIRLYDKKADTLKKRKSELYPDLMGTTGDVTRLEIELRASACKSYGFTMARLEDVEYLYNVFRRELSTRYVFFPLPSSVDSWFVRPRFDRGEPDAERRLWEALCKAHKKGVDIRRAVDVFLK